LIRADPPGLASAAQRVAAAVAALPPGEGLHPALSADDTSITAAARLSAAGTTLAATIAAQAAGLAATAAQMGFSATGLAEQESLNTHAVATLRVPGSAASGGWAPPPSAAAPDVRPPMAPPAPLPGEAIATALNTGTLGAAKGFIARWTQVADAVGEAADLLRRTANGLPEVWDSPAATPVVRAHLLGYANAFDTSAGTARAIAGQARRHAEQHGQTVIDVPSPAEFHAVDEQLRLVSRANAQSGGRLSAAVAALTAHKAALETKAHRVYAAYHAATEATTGSDAQAPDDRVVDPGRQPGAGPDGADPAAGGADGAMSPERAGQMAAMLPGMLPGVLGAAGGLVGGALSTVTKIPETLAQAAGAAAQGFSGAIASAASGPVPGPEKAAAADAPSPSEMGMGNGAGEGGGGGATTPASGGPTSFPPVVPTTGPGPDVPRMPAGASPQQVAAGAGTSAPMPMAMPMGAMMPTGAGGGVHSDQRTRPKNLVVPPVPHTESVTGKVTDRIAMSAAAKEPPPLDPPDDDPHRPRPIIRRIAMPKDGS
jgi:hypothetical protein